MNERLYQQNFIDLLSEKHGMDKKNAEKFIKEFFLLIEEALEEDRSVKIKGFGTFKLVDVESRESVKVNTGERFQIKGYTKVAFVPDNSLRDIINKPFAHFETVVLNENTILEDTPIVETEEDGDDIGEEVVSRKTEMIKEGASGVEEILQEDSVPLINDKTVFVEEASSVKEVTSMEVGTSNTKEDVPSDEEINLAGDVFSEKELVVDVVMTKKSLEEESAVFNSVVEDSVVASAQPFESEKVDHLEMSLTSQPAVKSKMSVAEIIAQELATATPAAPHKVQIERRSKSKCEKVEKSPLPYLISIIVIVILLCGGAVLFIYYPDFFSFHSKTEIVKNPVNDVHPEPNVLLTPQDTTILKKDTVAEVVSPVKEAQKVVQTPKKVMGAASEAIGAAKKENKSVAKPAPFKPDSVNYKITGTKTVYTIKEGETLTRVALRFYGTKALWPYIVKHNPDIIKNPDHVPFGTTIKIPELVKK